MSIIIRKERFLSNHTEVRLCTMKKVIVLFLAFMLLLNLCACGSVESIVDNLPVVGSNANKEYNPGDTAELDDISVTFIGVTESTGSDFFLPEEGNVFLLCEFEIVNNSNKELAVSSMMSFDAYCDDTAISLSISALSIKGNKNQLDGTVAAGKKMQGVVGYEVPADWTELEIQYTPNTFGSNKLTFVAPNN